MLFNIYLLSSLHYKVYGIIQLIVLGCFFLNISPILDILSCAFVICNIFNVFQSNIRMYSLVIQGILLLSIHIDTIYYIPISAVKYQISNIKSQIFFFRFGSNL